MSMVHTAHPETRLRVETPPREVHILMQQYKFVSIQAPRHHLTDERTGCSTPTWGFGTVCVPGGAALSNTPRRGRSTQISAIRSFRTSSLSPLASIRAALTSA